MNFLNLLFTGNRILAVINKTIIPNMEDRKLTVSELSNIIIEICAIFNYKLEIKVPETISDNVVEITHKLDTIATNVS